MRKVLCVISLDQSDSIRIWATYLPLITYGSGRPIDAPVIEGVLRGQLGIIGL